MKGTLKNKEAIERLFKKGRRSSSQLLTIIFLDLPTTSTGSCMYVAGKKLGNAPFRNRCKRVLRAAAHDLGAPWHQYDLAFIAHRKTAFIKSDILKKQMASQLHELGVL